MIHQKRCNDQRRSNEEHGSNSLRVDDLEGFFMNGNNGFDCCMNEVEKVLEEFYLKGEFGFGSFWDGEVYSRRFPFSPRSSCLGNKEVDYSVVHCHLIQIFGSNLNFREEQEIIDAL